MISNNAVTQVNIMKPDAKPVIMTIQRFMSIGPIHHTGAQMNYVVRDKPATCEESETHIVLVLQV
jgi:hypothetical protein